MRFVFFVLIGVLSGVVAGMGMGGGTILIPLLTIFMGVSQQVSQAVNLVVFIPLSIVVLIIYHKKGLLNLKNVWWVMIPGVIVSAIGSLFSLRIQNKTLSLIFGIFLIISGVIMAVTSILKQVKNNADKK